eukprot:4609674-Amphidinium_carterae.1
MGIALLLHSCWLKDFRCHGSSECAGAWHQWHCQLCCNAKQHHYHGRAPSRGLDSMQKAAIKLKPG